MTDSKMEAEHCPPGRIGAYAALGEPGYAAVVSGGPDQMAVFIRRAVAFHGGAVRDDEALQQLSHQHCSDSRSYQDLLDELNSCDWIAWPGLQRVPSTHLPTPTHAQATHDGEPSFGLPEIEGTAASSSVGEVGMPDPSQAFMGLSEVEAAENHKPSITATGSAGCCDHGLPAQASAPPPHEALQGGSPLLVEVHMDGAELCAEPFEDLGCLVISAPPWRPHHIFRSRMFSLVLRNPRDPSRGLVLSSSTNQQVVSETGRGILAELGSAAASLQDPNFYESIFSDPALLIAVAQSASGAPEVGIQEPLGSSSSNVIAESAAASSAGAPVDPAEEIGQCPICFEEIQSGAAAMRCNGEGGVHHYFHAHCLQDWIQACRRGRQATCPICRGSLQFNGHRLQEYLNGETSAQLPAEDRSFLQEISDGLRGSNSWSDMSKLEKTAYVGGIVAAAGYGFMLGFTDRYGRSAALSIRHTSDQHQVAQGVGWVAGLLARLIREVVKEKSRREQDQRRRS
eukprot:TRINITY_DN73790_c0_g1_i1.p1 TRINITY_DN73790_c0_g1~~TRINITY_DN73790_c0_g1_i1.p1  ORF type:complete len:512 (-),score=40.94 TRINITY_DN73790_c0_g1_i1:274-1809(-)